MANTPAVAAELRRAVLLRASELEEVVQHLRGPLGKSRSSLRTALGLVELFPKELRTVVAREWERNTDPDSRTQILTTLLRHANSVADFVELHLAHGTRRELSEALVEEIRRELEAFGLPQYDVVIAHGEAYNFTTTIGDLSKAILGPLSAGAAAPPGSPTPFAFFKMPRIEGAGIQWRPVLLGHEVTHVAVRERGAISAFDLPSKFDFHAAEGIPNPNARVSAPPASVAMGLYNIAEAWIAELICDAHALHRFGPAAVASLGEYFVAIGAMDSLAPSHPPGLLRMRLLLEHLGAVADPRLASIVEPWVDFTPATPSFPEQWADHLSQMFLAHSGAVRQTTDVFGTAPYHYADRTEVVGLLADRLKDGVPGREIVCVPGGVFLASLDADVVNAVWLARVEGSELPIDDLGKKAVESLDFVRRWIDHGGALPMDLYTPASVESEQADESEAAALSEVLISQRLRMTDERALIVTPLVHWAKGAGLDLRLGNRFIVFRRTGTASFDPLSSEDDPRAVQVHVELSWREQFVLHPQEVVLGSSLEYLVLPTDLTGQVITRSSYGRLGLLSATAVQIHPGYHGCLTLELVNLSTIPITLTPGERIAQLVLWGTDAVDASDEKYNYPIGPQFSRVRDDPEAHVLRSLRQG